MQLKFNHYISNCDLLYKYNTIKFDGINKVDSLVVDLPLKNYSNKNSVTFKENINSYIKFYLILYLIFSTEPKINYKKVENFISYYSLIIKIKKTTKIYSNIHKLYLIFFYNSQYQTKSNFDSIQNLGLNIQKFNTKNFFSFRKNNNLKDVNTKKINFRLKISINSINLLNSYANIFLSRLDLKSNFVYLNFHIQNSQNLNFSKHSLLNLPFFWSISKIE
jgi:hypothetical protein